MGFFTELEQIISQFVWQYKKTSNSQSILRKKNKAEGIMLTGFKLLQSHKVTVIETTWCWHENRHIDP